MTPRGKRRPKSGDGNDWLSAYRRVRKPMPPPERVIPDKRRKVEAQEAERELRESSDGPPEGS